MKNILIKSINNNLILEVKSTENFEESLMELKDDFEDLISIFPENKFRVVVKGAKLLEEQLEMIYDIVETSGLKISFLGEGTFLVKNFLEKANVSVSSNSKLEEEKVQKRVEKKPFLANQNETLFYTGSLRSGQSINFDGSVVIIGDVNAGADIKAEGNIICLGAIRGMAHAGAKGNKECYIYAYSLTPTQLRIADIITFVAQDVLAKNKNTPTFAQIQDSAIIIEQL